MGIYLKGVDFYPVLVKQNGTLFEASFIDMPNCRAYGATRAEAEANSHRALGTYLETMGRYGRALPKPSTVTDRGARDRYIAYIEGPENLAQYPGATGRAV